MLCAKHCSKLRGNSWEQNETSSRVERALGQGMGVRGKKIKANKQNIDSVSEDHSKREGRLKRRLGGLGRVAVLNRAISSLN